MLVSLVSVKAESNVYGFVTNNEGLLSEEAPAGNFLSFGIAMGFSKRSGVEKAISLYITEKGIIF